MTMEKVEETLITLGDYEEESNVNVWINMV